MESETPWWSRGHTLGMRVDVEILAAKKSDQRDAALPGKIDRQARRRGHGRDHRDAGNERLLHDLERRASADEQDAVRERQALLNHHPPDDFVDGVVPPDVFSHRLEHALAREEARGMQPAG